MTCGVGKKERPYWCQIDNRVVHPKHCKGEPPGIIEKCSPGPCSIWNTGDWGPVSYNFNQFLSSTECLTLSSNFSAQQSVEQEYNGDWFRVSTQMEV